MVSTIRELDEAEIVDRFRVTRQNRYFEELYRRTRRKVFGICLKYLRDVDHAADLSQEVFVRAYERFSTLRDGNFQGWVAAIAANLSLNRIRDQATQQHALQRLADEKPGESTPAAEEMATAEEILLLLSPEQRAVLILKYVDGYSYREIERLTGYSNDQVRSYLQNARRNFHILWQKRVVSRDRE